MKIALLLLSLVALVWSQGNNECHCGMFITVEAGELEVHRLPPINLNDCSEANECMLKCLEEWRFVYDNGGLDFQRPSSNLTFGEESCRTLENRFNMPDLDPTPVYNYYKICENPWMWDGAVSEDDLCCVSGQYPGHC
ncbi:hypothetical protein SK128_027676 [Halocaridina rubra]|uniref:Uncharacterized protein n=1 Tax=Halocaridina rubra TaxID=373956 RepID=A0AAN8XGP2_HALRR